MIEETKQESAPRTTEPAAPTPTIEDKSLLDILRALVGKTVTVVNPESYEAAPVGYKLTTGFYRGKLTGLGRDYLTMATEFERKKGAAEPVKQFIPLDRIKRISLTKGDRILHL
ncbi:MAG: hypothetical protein ACYTEZ_15970 [Planctomycetota bacterium]|jgi:hypothetical protein